jgi:hypothetical protein
MKREERISEEADRTLRSWDDDGVLREDPYMYSRIMAIQQERTEQHRSRRPFELRMKYALAALVVLVNIATALYLGFTPVVDLQEELVAQLQTDFQADPSQTNN